MLAAYLPALSFSIFFFYPTETLPRGEKLHNLQKEIAVCLYGTDRKLKSSLKINHSVTQEAVRQGVMARRANTGEVTQAWRKAVT